MNSMVLFIVVSLFCFIPAFRAEAQQRTQQVKVLIRKVNTGVVALDGGFLLIDVEKAAQNAKPQVLKNLRLTSAGGIRVEMESRTAIEFPGGQKWAEKQPYDTHGEAERDAAGFDFLVSWTLDWHELSKYQLSDKLKIDVKETWKVEKVADSSVTQTWTLSYLLTEEESLGLKDMTKRIAHAAVEQTATVIAPRRGPILKEIRAFIEANRAKRKNEPQSSDKEREPDSDLNNNSGLNFEQERDRK